MGIEKLTIGGVNFRKDDVKSSEVIERDGEQLNSVFLNDGTHIVYPNQDESKNPTVTQETLTYMTGDGTEYETGFRDTYIDRMSGAEVTGTEKHDTYILRGSNNIKVDLSQKDGKRDKVIQKDSKYNGEKFLSADNTVTLGEKKDKVTDSYMF